MSKRGTLIWKPLSADLKRDTDTFTKMDVYVVLKLGGDEKFTSSVARGGGKKPTWSDNLPIDIRH
jgi:hypothetical protein